MYACATNVGADVCRFLQTFVARSSIFQVLKCGINSPLQQASCRSSVVGRTGTCLTSEECRSDAGTASGNCAAGMADQSKDFVVQGCPVGTLSANFHEFSSVFGIRILNVFFFFSGCHFQAVTASCIGIWPFSCMLGTSRIFEIGILSVRRLCVFQRTVAVGAFHLRSTKYLMPQPRLGTRNVWSWCNLN